MQRARAPAPLFPVYEYAPRARAQPWGLCQFCPRARAQPLRPAVLAPARDTVLYCALACLARAGSTGSSVLNLGSRRAPERDRGHFVHLQSYN